MRRSFIYLSIIILITVAVFPVHGMKDDQLPWVVASNQSIGDKIRSNDLKRVGDGILQSVRSSIRLHTRKAKESSINPGESKIGGMPDLPKKLIWPIWKRQSLAFVAQINLTEIGPLDQENSLPETGMLYFFYDAKQETWGADPKDRDGWRVLYYNGSMQNLVRTGIPGDVPAEARFSPCKIRSESELSLPEWDSIYIDELKLTPKESDLYVELYESFVRGDVIHKVLGHPNQIQNEMQLECQLVSNGLYYGDRTGNKDPRRKELEKSAKTWRLLLQIDSDEKAGMMWGDAGRIYFWIREEDLKAKRFNKVWMIFQCG